MGYNLIYGSVYDGIYHHFMAIQYTLEHDYKSVGFWAEPIFRLIHITMVDGIFFLGKP
jgi:hypothetical protein